MVADVCCAPVKSNNRGCVALQERRRQFDAINIVSTKGGQLDSNLGTKSFFACYIQCTSIDGTLKTHTMSGVAFSLVLPMATSDHSLKVCGASFASPKPCEMVTRPRPKGVNLSKQKKGHEHTKSQVNDSFVPYLTSVGIQEMAKETMAAI